MMFQTCAFFFFSNLFLVQSFPTKIFVKGGKTLNQYDNLLVVVHHHQEAKTSEQFHEDYPEMMKEQQSISRRKIFQFSTSLTASLLFKPEPSHANLVQFPCDYKLMNTYHIMRAGESILESEDIISTNPLFLTNREDALSGTGIEQVEATCREMAKRDINPSVVKFSLAAKAIDTADIVAAELQVGRNRLVPEYTFMDPRGLGLWDRQKLSIMEGAIWAMDHDEAGKYGYGGTPPANDDSTPNETLSNQVVRLRELMSLLETQCSGDTILLVFGDGTSPALLSTLIAGLPLHRTHELNFNPGEIRFDVTMNNVLNSLPDEVDAEYLNKIASGRETLQKIRANPRQFTASGEEVSPKENTFYQPITRSTKSRSSNNNDLESREIRQSDFQSFFGLSLFGIVARHLSKESYIGEETDDMLEVEESQKLKSSVSRNEVNSEDQQSEDMAKSNNNGYDKLHGVQNIEEMNELQKLEDFRVNAPFDIPEMKNKRVEKAEIAMEAYLNQDDGGEDWLSLMNEIMYEQEEDNSLDKVGM